MLVVEKLQGAGAKPEQMEKRVFDTVQNLLDPDIKLHTPDNNKKPIYNKNIDRVIAAINIAAELHSAQNGNLNPLDK